MTSRRLVPFYFLAIFLLVARPVQAQNQDAKTLTGIGAMSVSVSILRTSDSLGLTEDTIQNDVELKLRLAGIRVVTGREGLALPGDPYIDVSINASDGRAASIKVEVRQDAVLTRNGETAVGVTTWGVDGLVSNPTAQGIRNFLGDMVDRFLNAWLSVNPRK